MNKIKKCEFCNNSYPIKSNKGSEQRFCSDNCRNQFHSYGRKYVSILISKGKIDFKSIKKQVDYYF